MAKLLCWSVAAVVLQLTRVDAVFPFDTHSTEHIPVAVITIADAQTASYPPTQQPPAPAPSGWIPPPPGAYSAAASAARYTTPQSLPTTYAEPPLTSKPKVMAAVLEGGSCAQLRDELSTSRIVDSSFDTSPPIRHGVEALFAAAGRERDVECVRFLLRFKSLSSTDIVYDAFVASVAANWDVMVSALLSHIPFDPEDRTQRLQRAVLLASYYDSYKAQKAILDSEHVVFNQEVKPHKQLYYAAVSGSVGATGVLLGWTELMADCGAECQLRTFKAAVNNYKSGTAKALATWPGRSLDWSNLSMLELVVSDVPNHWELVLEAIESANPHVSANVLPLALQKFKSRNSDKIMSVKNVLGEHDSEGLTYVHMAAKAGSPYWLERLLNTFSGFNLLSSLSTASSSVLSPLQYATEAESTQCMELLLKRPGLADFEWTESSPFHMSIRQNCLPCLEKLLEHKVSVLDDDVKRWFELMGLATEVADVNILEFLLEKFAEYHAVDNYVAQGFLLYQRAGRDHFTRKKELINDILALDGGQARTY